MKSVLTLCAGLILTTLIATSVFENSPAKADEEKKVEVIKIKKTVDEKEEATECEACKKAKDGKCEKCASCCSKSGCSTCSQAKVVEESMHEFMEYVYQPTYKRLKASMASEPADNGGWKAIKADSLSLAESGNLLLIHQPKENAEEWNGYAVATRELGGELYQAARKKDFQAATESYKAMLLKCNACHKTFAKGKYQLKP